MAKANFERTKPQVNIGSLGHIEQARQYLDRALEEQSSPAERALLRRKRVALDGRD